MKYKYILFFCIAVCLETAFLCAQSKEKDVNVQNPALRQEILEMFKRDQAIIKEIRDKKVKSGNLIVLPEDEQRQRAVVNGNTNRVKQIVGEYGFPTKELIGDDGISALNTLVLHAIHDPEFQTYYLGLLQKAVKNKQVPGQELAYLTDKIRMNAGKPQLYGTQPLSDAKGNIEPYPIEDAANVDKRRAALGMESLEEYLNVIRRLSREQEERIHKEDITALLQQVYQARKNSDAEKLNQLLALDYVEISPAGNFEAREKVLEFYFAEQKNTQNNEFISYELNEPAVRIYDKTAIVFARVLLVFKGKNGQTNSRAFRCMFVCRKVDGKWRLSSSQFTEERTQSKKT